LVARHLFLAGLAPRHPKTDQYHLFDLMFAHRWDFLVKLVRVLPGLCRELSELQWRKFRGYAVPDTTWSGLESRFPVTPC
jgi:hypothetical protein